MSVAARLALAFGLMICMMIGGAGLGLFSIHLLQQKIQAQASIGIPALVVASRLQEDLLRASSRLRLLPTIVEPQQVRDELARARDARGERAGLVAQLGRLLADGRGAAFLTEIVKAARVYDALEQEFLNAGGSGQDQAWSEVLVRVRAAEDAYSEALARLTGDLADEAREWSRDGEVAYQRSRDLMFALSALAIVLAAAVAWRFSRRLRLQLGGEPDYAAHVAGRIARGDLSVQVDLQPGDQDSLLYAMSRMAASLRQLVGEVAGGARVVADTSTQIAQGNVDLSQRTEEQACTLEETASSMEELTTTVMQNAESARKASQLALDASEVARRGGEVVGQVVATMTDISGSSRKIGDIIAVIDGIAFQTNILALNASVEAARAGEQGRGFAVVASEVRNLAQRSAAAAREIKALIGDSVGKVEAGSRLVDAAGKTMDDIVGSVKGVTELIAEIAAASQEQSSGIEQVNMAVTQMEQVVQQNASLVEEATAATESMKDQASGLLRSVARFKLGDEEEQDTQPQPPPRPEAAVPLPARTWSERPPQWHGGAAVALGAPQSAKEWQEF
ncbi:methyl-accepting chemotaxis protein [Ramlibacter sp. RBP-2]|uniref:Methyl-accepting chemotaxis protein n=2 Tax=Ramlibacter lithotrophicus TaxID=2606681 RepID=A0A7X6DHY0_9BURK|nr:methyl-accepting chemotaxis protein [Ramlibacter lithotrophicus]